MYAADVPSQALITETAACQNIGVVVERPRTAIGRAARYGGRVRLFAGVRRSEDGLSSHARAVTATLFRAVKRTGRVWHGGVANGFPWGSAGRQIRNIWVPSSSRSGRRVLCRAVTFNGHSVPVLRQRSKPVKLSVPTQHDSIPGWRNGGGDGGGALLDIFPGVALRPAVAARDRLFSLYRTGKRRHTT